MSIKYYATEEYVDKAIADNSVDEVVLYTEQELTEEQKMQARSNIGVDGFDWHYLGQYKGYVSNIYPNISITDWDALLAVPSSTSSGSSAFASLASSCKSLLTDSELMIKENIVKNFNSAMADLINAGISLSGVKFVYVYDSDIGNYNQYWFIELRYVRSSDTWMVTDISNKNKLYMKGVSIKAGQINYDGVPTYPDTTLTLSGRSADAKAVGDALAALATEEYVNTQVANLVNSAPDKLNTLDELAAALGNDENFANTVTTQIANKANKDELPIIDATLSNVGQAADAKAVGDALSIINDKAIEIDNLSASVDSHIGNKDIHVTSAEKEAWNSKADSNHNHDSVYDAKGAAASALEEANIYTDETCNALWEDFGSAFVMMYGIDAPDDGGTPPTIRDIATNVYMENRTHGIELDSTEQLLPDTVINIGEDGGGVYITTPIEVITDETYLVRWNGKKYFCTVKETLMEDMGQVQILGNAGAAGAVDIEPSNEPFAILILPPEIANGMGVYGAILVVDGTTNTAVTISIEGGLVETYVPLDIRYLPDNVITNEELESKGYATKEYVDANAGSGSGNISVPTKLSELKDDSTHRLVTDEEKAVWNSAEANANEYTDSKIANLLNNSTEAVDSIMELANAMENNADAIEVLNNIAANKANKSIYGDNTISNGRLEDSDRGSVSIAYGDNVIASGHYSQAFGADTIASNYASHAEGSDTIASGYTSHTEGYLTQASGDYSHAEGSNAVASGNNSHAEGYITQALGDYSHAEGRGTKASGVSQHVQGRYNSVDNENRYAHIVGNGTYNEQTQGWSSSNAHTLDWDGNAWFQGDVYVGGASQDDGKKLATEEYVNTQIANRVSSLKDGTYDVLAINHRGYSKEAPENTIPAYILSKQKGYNYVECDVSFTADGVAVLLHDATIDRTSDGSGNISELTYNQVLQYDFGSWFSTKYKGTKIPTFSEFIRYCKGLGLHPYIELKSNGGYTQEQIGQIVSEVELCGMKGKVTYISFSSTFLRYVKEHDPQARLGYIANITSSTIAEAVALKTGKNEVFMDVNYTYLTDNKILSCIENDLPLEVWTVNQASVIKELHPYVTGVTSDNQHAGNILYTKYSTYTYSEDTGDTPDEVEVTAITSNTGSNTATLEKGGTVQLGVTYTPSDTTQTDVYWTTSSESIAKVSNTGVVTGVAAGNATITATSTYNSSLKVVWTITVNDNTSGEDPGDGDDTTPTMYTITNNLTNVNSSNSEASVEKGSSYTANISVLDGYTILRTTITMGGIDITSSAYSDGVISIDSVNGDVVITIVASDDSYEVVRTITQDELHVGKQIASSGSPYYNDNKARTSYIDFDLAYETGYTYKFDFITGNDTECSIGTQWYNQTGKKNQENGAVLGTSNVYDPGWLENGAEVTPPQVHNGSAIAGYRLTFKRNNNSNMANGDIASVTISRKMTE